MQQRLQVLCDLAYTPELSSAGIFTLRMTCSAMRTSQATFRSTTGKKGLEDSGVLLGDSRITIEAAGPTGSVAGLPESLRLRNDPRPPLAGDLFG